MSKAEQYINLYSLAQYLLVLFFVIQSKIEFVYKKIAFKSIFYTFIIWWKSITKLCKKVWFKALKGHQKSFWILFNSKLSLKGKNTFSDSGLIKNEKISLILCTH